MPPSFSRGLGAAALVLGLAAVAAPVRAEDLSADDAVARAAERNPTLRAALLDALAARQNVAAETGDRRPVVAASVTGSYTETLSEGRVAAGRGRGVGVGADTAVRYTTDVGTQLEVGASGDLARHDTTTGAADPVTRAEAHLTVRQPLLRGAGTDAVLAPLAQAEANADAAVRQGDVAASQLALDVLTAYWELWYAEEAVAVQTSALASARRQLADAKVRAETLGTGTRVDVLQFATQAASLEDALAQARATRATRALALGRLLGEDPTASVGLHAVGDVPAATPPPSLEEATRAAKARSPELAATRSDLDAQRARVAAAEDADQPKLDAFVTGTVGALWANDALDAFALPDGRPALSVIGGLELELPFGGGRQAADAARARTQLRAAEARYEAQVDALEADVGSLRIGVESSDDQVAFATETAALAAQLAEAERQRLQLGTTTASDVVKAEQTHREAELRKLRAAVTSATHRYAFEHASGSLLDRFQVLRRRTP